MNTIETISDADLWRVAVIQSTYDQPASAEDVALLLGMTAENARLFMKRVKRVGRVESPINARTIRTLHRQVDAAKKHAYLGRLLRLVQYGEVVVKMDTPTRRYLETLWFAYQPLVRSLGPRKGTAINPNLFDARLWSTEDPHGVTTGYRFEYWNADDFRRAPAGDGFCYALRAIRKRKGLPVETVQPAPVPTGKCAPWASMGEDDDAFRDADSFERVEDVV